MRQTEAVGQPSPSSSTPSLLCLIGFTLCTCYIPSLPGRILGCSETDSGWFEQRRNLLKGYQKAHRISRKPQTRMKTSRPWRGYMTRITAQTVLQAKPGKDTSAAATEDQTPQPAPGHMGSRLHGLLLTHHLHPVCKLLLWKFLKTITPHILKGSVPGPLADTMMFKSPV